MKYTRFTIPMLAIAGIVVLVSCLFFIPTVFTEYQTLFILFEDVVILGLCFQILRRRKGHKTVIARMLAARERWFAATLNSIGDAVITTDNEGVITFMNPVAEALTGWKGSEALGKDIAFKMSDEEPAFSSETHEEEAFQRDIVIQMAEAPFLIGREGMAIPIEYSGAPIKDDRGNITGMVLVLHDRTERKRAEDALRKAHDELEIRVQERTAELAKANEILRQLEKAVETMQIGVTITDLTGKILYTNPEDATMHGYTVDELLGQDVQVFAPPERRRQMSVDQVEAMKGWVRESLNIRKDGRIFPVYLMSGVVRGDAGRATAIVTTCEDITERKQAEARIQQINVILRAIRDINQLIVREKDRDRLIQQVCKSFIETRGFSAAWIALLNEAHEVVTAAESGIGAPFEVVKARLAAKELLPCMQQVLTQTNALLLEDHDQSCSNCALADLDEDQHKMIVRLEHAGKCYGVLATFLPQKAFTYDEELSLLEEVAGDIGFALYSIEMEEERKQAEQALEQERQRLFDLLEQLPVYVYLQSPDYSIRFANRCFRERFGSPESTHNYKLLWGRGEFWEESPTFRVFTTHKPYEWEWDHYPTAKTYHVYDYPFTDFDGSPLVLELGIDITERKQMEVALKEERASLAEKVEERTLALSTINERLQQEVEERKRAETWLLSMNDQLQQEITERKKVEEELQQAKEAAEAASSAKSEFLANMSHELRTPLNAILGYAQILKTAENLTERQREGLDTIKNSGQHLLNLINEVLDLSKIEAGRLELELNEFHLPALLKHIAEMMRIRAEQKGLASVYEPGPDLPEGVRADEKKLRQILINLLGNAVKFTEKGSVSLRVFELNEFNEFNELNELKNSETQKLRNSETQKLPNSQTHKTLRFEIEDTGIGIPANQLEDIFLPFQQVGEKRYWVEGTGLGLSISRKLVRLMGGELTVNSTVGKGSVFGFDLQLPIVEGIAPSKVQPARKIIGYQGPQRTLLIADDRQENRAVLVNMLFPLGFKIVEAENGQECLEKALQYRPDAILLDLRMPVMDGFETAKQIRQHDKLHVVIIAVSASVYAEIRARSLQAGCDAFLTKPLELETILDILQTRLQLAWVYTEEPEAPIPLPGKPLTVSESAHELPEEQVRILIELASKGRAKKLLQALADLEIIAQGQHPILEELHQFAKNFQFQEVITRLTRGRRA